MSTDLTQGSKVTLAVVLEQLKNIRTQMTDGFNRVHDDVSRVVTTAGDHEKRLRSIEGANIDSISDHEKRLREVERAMWKNAGVSALVGILIAVIGVLVK